MSAAKLCLRNVTSLLSLCSITHCEFVTFNYVSYFVCVLVIPSLENA